MSHIYATFSGFMSIQFYEYFLTLGPNMEDSRGRREDRDQYMELCLFVSPQKNQRSDLVPFLFLNKKGKELVQL